MFLFLKRMFINLDTAANHCINCTLPSHMDINIETKRRVPGTNYALQNYASQRDIKLYLPPSLLLFLY
jgi:hypothetical protein